MTTPPPRWPRTRGNVWMLSETDGTLDYLSDQFQGRTIGFQERDGMTMAQTPPLALGMVAMGSGVSIERPLTTPYPYHVFDENLDSEIPNFAATSHATIASTYAEQDRLAFKTIFAVSAPQPGITEAEALPSSDLYQGLLTALRSSADQAKTWDKSFHIDRICLSLLAGAPKTTERSADFHYAAVAQELRGDTTMASGQGSFPTVIVSQSAGTRFDGTSEVILAEGRLNYEHPTIGFLVATPKYPFDLMPDMPATLSAEAMLLIDELEHLALAALHRGESWICPALQRAVFSDTVITAEFSTLSDLQFDDADLHGFAVRDSDVPVNITSAQVSGKTVTLTCDARPSGKNAHLTYAWGETCTTPKAHNRPANFGTLRDQWSADSLMMADTPLNRYALSGRVKLMAADAKEWI